MRQKLIKKLKESKALEDFFFFGTNGKNGKDDPFNIHLRYLIFTCLMYMVTLIPLALLLDVIWRSTAIEILNPNGWFGFLLIILGMMFLSVPSIIIKVGTPIAKVLSRLRIYTCTESRILKIIAKEFDYQKKNILNNYEIYEEYLSGNIDLLSKKIDIISSAKLVELLQMDVNSIQALDKKSLSIVVQGRIDYFTNLLKLKQSIKLQSDDYKNYTIVKNIHKTMCIQ